MVSHGGRIAAAVLICSALAVGVEAAVYYLPERDLLWVTDYPADLPCTPRLLARVDRTFGWGKVEYDEATDTCTVGCSLWIGKNDGSETYLQVGSAQRPRETLTVRGDVRVHSAYLAGENSEDRSKARGIVNRLTIGVRGDPSVRARLLIDNRDRVGHTLIVGGFSGYGSENNGGQLCVYNSAIAPCGDALIGERDAAYRSMEMGGSDLLELVNATVNDVGGLAFGRHMARGTFEGVRFERCGVAVHGTYMQVMKGCTFSDCGTALIGSSRYDLVLRDCTFAGNEHNWMLHYKPLVAIDCDIDSWDKGGYSVERDTFFIAKRHVVVRVVDADGNPVKDAAVRASTAGEPPAAEFDLRHAVTDADGRTPGRDTKGALVLSEILIGAPEQEGGEPPQTTYGYNIEATAGDHTGRVEGFTPRDSWEEITITLVAPDAEG